MKIQDIIIQSNIMYDYQATHTQTIALRLIGDGNMSNVLIANNNGIRSPIFLQIDGVGTFTTYFKSNIGYSPGNSIVTAGTSPWTYTNNDGYDEILILSTANGITGINYRSSSGYPLTPN